MPRKLVAIFTIANALALLFALFSQHILGMQPCPWCVAQRVVLAISAAAGALLLCLPRIPQALARASAGVGAVLMLTGAAMALHLELVAKKSSSCAMTFADKFLDASGLVDLLPFVFEPRASCADGAAYLVGIPYGVWAASYFALMAGFCVVSWRKSSEA